MKKLDNVFLEAKRNYEYVGIDKKNGSHIFLVPCKLCQKPKKVRLSWIRTNKVPICKNCSVENRRVKALEEKTDFFGTPIVYCRTCGAYLNEDNIHKNTYALRKGGLGKCKICWSEKRKQYRKKERDSATARKNREKNYLKTLLISAERWAKHRNQEVEIDEKWIEERFHLQDNKCYWFNTLFEMKFSGRHPLKPSLDRLDPSIGYIKVNTVIASYAANFGRNETDVIVWQDFIQSIRFQNSSNQFNES